MLGVCHFKVAPESHLLTDFTIDGKPIAERLVAGGVTATSSGARFTLTTGYQKVESDSLELVVEVKTGPEEVTVNGKSGSM